MVPVFAVASKSEIVQMFFANGSNEAIAEDEIALIEMI
jgi:hypothetical protein